MEWKRYKKNPMPRCTWANESGAFHWRLNPEWHGPRYHAKNLRSSASGKYQILDTTWRAFGGRGPSAREASALAQERVARRVLKGQGIGAWEGCR